MKETVNPKHDIVMEICKNANVKFSDYFNDRKFILNDSKADASELHVKMRHPVNDIDTDGWFDFHHESDLPDEIKNYIITECSKKGVL